MCIKRRARWIWTDARIIGTRGRRNLLEVEPVAARPVDFQRVMTSAGRTEQNKAIRHFRAVAGREPPTAGHPAGHRPPGRRAVMAPLWNSKCLLPFRYA